MAVDPSVLVTDSTYVVGGSHYTRVTRVLNVLHNEGIEAWKLKVGAEEAKRILEEASSFGTRVHSIVEGINLDPHGYRCQDAEMLPWFEAYHDWWHANVRATVSSERLVLSHVHRYAGTLDMILDLKDGRRVIVDAKTNRTSVSSTARLQMSAYAHALVETEDEEIDGRLVVWMPSSKPGKLVVMEFDNPQDDWDAFEAALTLYRWREAHKHDWKRRAA